MPPRRAGAPRLIEWTGERAVPWAPGVQTYYEHFHRYFWVQQLARGRKVLDLGSGEGFGAALLADVAARVVGVDVDPRTVEHSTLNYQAPTLEFRVGSAEDLGSFDDDSFDLVVAFEMIEHVENPEAVLEQVDRVLAPGGLLVASTPDRRTYSQATGHVNPFHVHELSEDDFAALLRRRFGAVALFGQRAATGSRIEVLRGVADGQPSSVHLERSGDEWRVAGSMCPMYLIAVAAHEELPPGLPGASTLSDFGLEQLREMEEEADRRLAEAEADLQATRGETEGLRSELAVITTQLDDSRRELGMLQAEIDPMRRELRRVQESVSWRQLQRLQEGVYAGIGGRDGAFGRALAACMRAVGRLTDGRAREQAPRE